LGNDLAPSNIFSDVGSDTMKVLDNPIADVGIGLTALTAGLALPGLLGADAGLASVLPYADPTEAASLGAATAAAPTAFADTGAAAGDLSTFIANPTTAGLSANDIVAQEFAAGGANTVVSNDFSALAANPLSYSYGSIPADVGYPAVNATAMSGDLATPSLGAAVQYDPGVYGYGEDLMTGDVTMGAGGTVTPEQAVAAGYPTPGSPGSFPYTDPSTAPGPTGTAPISLTPTIGPGAPAATGANAPGPVANFFSGLTGGAVSPQTMSIAGQVGLPALGIAGLGYNLYSGLQTQKNLNALAQTEQANAQSQLAAANQAQAAAAPELNWGQALQQYLVNGTLPPAFQQQIAQIIAQQKAMVIQGYASRGQNTDPNQNSALAQDLAAVDANSLSLQTQVEQTLATAGGQMVQQANQLISTGVNATQMASQLPIQVAELNNQLAQQMGTSIANFAAALNGNTRFGGNAGAITLQFAQPSGPTSQPVAV
jgi:hypothetical protein